MRITRYAWVFCFFLGMALFSGAAGWFFFLQLPNLLNRGVYHALSWLVPAYLVVLLLLAGLFTFAFSIFLNRSNGSLRLALQHLARAGLPRLASALSKLSEGDLTVHIDEKLPHLNAANYPGAQEVVSIYDEMIDELRQIYRNFNDITDEPCQRLVYVGADSFQEGRICCELMGQAIGGSGKVAIITSLHTHAMEIRKSGFVSMLSEKFPAIQMVSFIDCQSQLDNVYPRVMELLKKFPDLAGIYATNGNTPHLIARALVDAGKAGKVKLVCHDLVDTTMEAMQRGIVSSTISQDPYSQGHDPVIYLYNYLVAGALPPRPRMITKMDRITKENYQQFWDPQIGPVDHSAAEARLARPVSMLPKRELRILVIGREDISFFDPVKRGALAAAEELKSHNTLVEWIEPELARKNHTFGSEEYGPVIEDAIASNWDAVVVPIYDKSLVPYINRAVAAGIPVATYNSEPSSLRNLINNLIHQSEHLRKITMELAESAVVSEEHANKIRESIGMMSKAILNEVQSSEAAIQRTEEIALTMDSIGSGAKEQTGAVNSVSEAIANISNAVSSTNETALTSVQTADQAMAIAQDGAQVIKQTLGQIQAIREAVSISVDQIHGLTDISKQIGTIVSTVTDFAEQTNLLALNAAIEAAHAGEYGTGFAVVGAEIRDLARKSKTSTQEIAMLVKAIQISSNKMVKTVDAAMVQAQSGSMLAAQAGHSLDALLNSAESMKGQTEKVVQANTSLVATLDQLNEANKLVSAVVEKNVSATEQVTGSIQQAVGMINQMTSMSVENSRSIEGIQNSTDDVVARAQQLKESILTLVTMAEELRSSAGTFKITE